MPRTHRPAEQGSAEQGSALVWWALFISLAAFPLLVLVVEGGRFFRAAGDVQKAADAAAEAAVREVDLSHYVETGEVRLSGNEYALAHEYANRNAEFLRMNRVTVVIVAITADDSTHTVLVTSRADVSRLLPRFTPALTTLERTGVAQVRISAP